VDSRFELYRSLAVRTPSKIVFLVMDGLGGLVHPDFGRSELEAARLPNLDALARESATGLSLPIGHGITPGSGPSHLALFGYDPLSYEVGRGLLSVLGIDLELRTGDVAARVNFCTVDDAGIIRDRRAGRIATTECARLCALLREIRIPGLEIQLQPEMDYRAALLIRGAGLDGRLSDSDPQREGFAPLPVSPKVEEATATADLLNAFLGAARERLRNESPANMILLRGFAQHQGFPSMRDTFALDPACIAAYPMYRGVSRLVGMKVLATGSTIEDEVKTLEQHWGEHDFFFFHVKKTDSAGEDGNFEGKVAVLEAVDALLPRLRALQPDVIVVTGDHSTPSALSAHSWHPVPVILWGRHCQPDSVTEFHERALQSGSLCGIHHVDLMPLAMANAFKFLKYGA